MKISQRDVPPRAAWQLEQNGLHPLLAALYAARGVRDAAELDPTLSKLLPPNGLLGIQAAAALLANAIAAQKRICVVADYDCDGATACAVALRGLRLLGAQQLGYVVPDRMVDGYGLTPPIADRVAATQAEVLVTVDNGIASVDGVAHAKALGLEVLITDHHLPGDTLPAANACVNPNQPNCGFASKSLAGVGVMFYVLLALRAELRQRGAFANTGDSKEAHAPQKQGEPRLDSLLPLVALGTVADVVRLDANNRRLVAQGLQRMRAGAAPLGLLALFDAAGRKFAQATAADLGFAIGPRINAAGRLADMRLGIECLLCDDATRAHELAHALDAVNRERRSVQDEMNAQAQHVVEQLQARMQGDLPAALCVADDSFHEGVVGIVAGRLKDQLHRPCFVFAPSAAPGQEHCLKGSGRSIAGFHLRDALDWVSKRHPHVLLRFGGHAMAAGCTIPASELPRFEAALAEVAQRWLSTDQLQRTLLSDGALQAEYHRADVAQMLAEPVWGQGFEAPLFCNTVQVLQQRLVGEKHLALKVQLDEQTNTPAKSTPIDAIWFGHTDSLPAKVRLAYRLQHDEWQGRSRVQWIVEAVLPV